MTKEYYMTNLQSVKEEKKECGQRGQERNFGGKAVKRRLGGNMIDRLENLRKF